LSPALFCLLVSLSVRGLVQLLPGWTLLVPLVG
jgi:hypothetical protein